MKRKNVENEETTTYPNEESRCENCRWYLGNRKCAAFNKIPDEVWNGVHDKIEDGQTAPLIFNSKGNNL